MNINPNTVHRTAKLFADSGEADSLEQAHKILMGYELQLEIGPEAATNRTLQAAVLTAINAAARSFLGGVSVHLVRDPVLTVGWDSGERLSTAITRHGGTVVDSLRDEVVTICFGNVSSPAAGRTVLRGTFDGWTAGVVEGTETPLKERDAFVPAGVAAGGIAVAEAFQILRGELRAGRRKQGISLWCPEADWLSDEAIGPLDVSIAPSDWWVIGLGHLGQGYLWAIGHLPYADPTKVRFMLQDDDFVTEANESTGLLTPTGWLGLRKTRALAGVLEKRGFVTALTERRFDHRQGPRGGEPRLALVGVDNPGTRRIMSDAEFSAVIDCGLGGGPDEYLAAQVHTFPGARRSDEIPSWQELRTDDLGLLELPAYRELATSAEDQCGVVEVAGRAVAAAFVGATAGALVVAEAFRLVLGDHRYAVIDANLRDLTFTAAIPAVDAPPVYPGFTELA